MQNRATCFTWNYSGLIIVNGFLIHLGWGGTPKVPHGKLPCQFLRHAEN